MPPRVVHTRCCVAGAGPAGMMLGLLLARAGIDVVVLEKHADFLRDFRGDTVHPSTLEVIAELGLLDDFLRLPHRESRQLGGEISGQRVKIADFTHLPARAKFIALTPQWVFLDFLAAAASRYPSFRLHMESEVVDLIRDGERMAGVMAQTPEGSLEVRSDLTVGADGRGSVVRERADLEIEELGAPIDVLWIRLSREPDDPAGILGYIRRGHVFVTLDRGEYWQCGFVIPKGSLDERRGGSVASLREEISAIVPLFADRVDELRSWDDVKLLTVRVDRLRTWCRPGLLCIGDAAHAMSPIGGVGINLAIQDAVAAANMLTEPLRRGAPSLRDLRRVERRRALPAHVTQRLQVFVQERVLRPVLSGATPGVPWMARLLDRSPLLRRVPARAIGIGVRPEHVRDGRDAARGGARSSERPGSAARTAPRG